MGMIRRFASLLLPRVLRFRKETLLLWKAFFSPHTPLYLKAATLLAAFYLINPFDLIPDVVPFIGIIDDVIIIPLVVSWIVSRLPVMAPATAPSGNARTDQTIDATYRHR